MLLAVIPWVVVVHVLCVGGKMSSATAYMLPRKACEIDTKMKF